MEESGGKARERTSHGYMRLDLAIPNLDHGTFFFRMYRTLKTRMSLEAARGNGPGQGASPELTSETRLVLVRMPTSDACAAGHPRS